MASAVSIPVIVRAAVAARGIVAGGQHDSHGGARPRADRARVQLPHGGRSQHVEEVAVEERHERLRLRVAEAAVVLEHPRPVRRQHQPREERADEGVPAGGELGDDRAAREVDEPFQLVAVDPRHRREGPHATGVRALVAVECPLEVLRRRQRDRRDAVTEREDRDLGPLEQLLDDERAAEALELGEPCSRPPPAFGRRRRPCRLRGRPP